jgi:hypothetical protein
MIFNILKDRGTIDRYLEVSKSIFIGKQPYIDRGDHFVEHKLYIDRSGDMLYFFVYDKEMEEVGLSSFMAKVINGNANIRSTLLFVMINDIKIWKKWTQECAR